MKLTIEQIECVIRSEQFHNFPDTGVTVCCLLLHNGTYVIGESWLEMGNDSFGIYFDFELGKKYARQAAVKKLCDLVRERSIIDGLLETMG